MCLETIRVSPSHRDGCNVTSHNVGQCAVVFHFGVRVCRISSATSLSWQILRRYNWRFNEGEANAIGARCFIRTRDASKKQQSSDKSK
jgi:hypothetical protein